MLITLVRNWWLLALRGVCAVLFGILAFSWPGLTLHVVTLVFLIAGWALVTGALQLIAAIRLRKEIEGEFWLGLTGVLSILFGLLLIFRPGVGLVTIAWLIGGYALVFGIFLIALAFRVKGFRNRLAASRA